MQLPGLIVGWYTCSIALSLYNKWMFDPHKGLRIPFPILITSIHQFLLWGLSYTYLRSRGQLSKEPPKGWSHYFRYVIPTALSSAGDVGFGNVSFKFITLTMYTIVKSSSIAFVLLFGCICKLERFRLRLALIVVVMFCGVVLMVYKPERSMQEHSTDDELIGFFLVLASSCLSGLRWVYTQMLLQQSFDTGSVRNGKKTNPMHTIHSLSPLMGFALFITALVIEKPFPVIASTNIMTWDGHSKTMALLRGAGMLISPGIAVFIMTICEFGILQAAPVLTLSIAGIVKELFTIFTGIIVLHESLGFYNWIGMAIVLLDVCFYNYYRYSESTSLGRPYTPLDSDPEASRELDDLSVK